MKKTFFVLALCALLAGASTAAYTTASIDSYAVTPCFAFGDMVGGY